MNFSYKAFFCCIIAADLAFGIETPDVSEDLIEKINKMNTTWKAGVNHVRFPKEFTPIQRPRKFTGRVPPHTNLPRFFDVRRHWPQCRSMTSRIRDQGACSSSWAVAVASMMSDRACIQSNGSWMYYFSAHDVMSCPDHHRVDLPCVGGDVLDSILQFESGVVTGGEVDSNEGCKPYGRKFYQGGNEECVRNCTNPNYKTSYEKDKLYASDFLGLFVEEHIRQEIGADGPVVAQITVYEDILYYKTGIYQHVLGKELGVHVVKLIGWGERNGIKYWIVVNSHGKNYGYKGTMRFLRGVGHCGIELVRLTTLAGKEPPFYRQAAIHKNQADAIKHFRVKYLFVEAILFHFLLYWHQWRENPIMSLC